jgi:MFS family permease
LGPLCGPLLAPIIGGVMAQKLGWRSTQWFLVVYGGLTFAGLLFCLPETLKQPKPAPENPSDASSPSPTSQSNAKKDGERALQRVSTRQSIQEKTKGWVLVMHRCFIEPLKIILYLRFPAVAFTVYYASITFGSLYFLNVSIQETFSHQPYQFSAMIVGLLYIPSATGYIAASVTSGKWSDWIMAREAKRAGRYDVKGKLEYRPEDRLRENAWLAAVMYPGALLWYGWTTESDLHWLIPVSWDLHS